MTGGNRDPFSSPLSSTETGRSRSTRTATRTVDEWEAWTMIVSSTGRGREAELLTDSPTTASRISALARRILARVV
jgi:hypothetical protein